MDICQNAQVAQSLRAIVEGPYNKRQRLKMLKEIESHHRNGTSSTILPQLIKMVPLTKSVESLHRLLLLFLGRLLELLGEMEILTKKELAQETLQLVKQFLSLCSNQQLVVAPMEVFFLQTDCQWLPLLLEVVSSLASVFIDLFIVSYKHFRNKALWSKRLYSWLTFNLNQRSIKTALLEVNCPIKKSSELLSPVLSKIIASPLVYETHMDYLLHMLLLKKWSPICDQAEVEISSNVKVPENFVSWLKNHWGKSHDYIPQDKSFKGKRVTEFILDLDDEAIDSLTDMFTDCLRGEGKTAGITDATLEEKRPAAVHFVVDKKGSRSGAQVSQPSTSCDARKPNKETLGPSFILDTKGSDVVMQVSDSEDDVQFIKKSNDTKPKGQKRKHEAAEQTSILLDGTEELNYFIIPDRKSETNSSPNRKKQRIGTRNEESSDIIASSKRGRQRCDSNLIHEEVEILNDEGVEHGGDDDDNDNPLGLDVIDFESLSKLAESVEADTLRVSNKVWEPKGISQQKGRTRQKDSILKSVHKASEGIREENDDDVVELDTRSQVVNGESDLIEIGFEASSGRKGRTNQTQAKINSSKALLLSDPVSSYFTPQKETEYIDKMQIYDLTSDAEDAEDAKDKFRIFDEEVSFTNYPSDCNFARDCKDEQQKAPKNKRSSKKGVVHHGRSQEKQTVIQSSTKGVECKGRSKKKTNYHPVI